MTDWRSIKYPATSIALTVDGVAKAQGSARAILGGDPVGAVVLLANHQPPHSEGLKRGQIVTTGSCTGMTAIAKGLTDEEIQSVAQYYSAAKPTLTVTRPGQPDLVSRGQSIATEGSLQNCLQACVSCHGPKGMGESPAIPYLSGQYKHYIQLQLEMFKKGYRKDVQMGTVGHRVSDEEAAAVAAYFDQLPMPAAQ